MAYISAELHDEDRKPNSSVNATLRPLTPPAATSSGTNFGLCFILSFTRIFVNFHFLFTLSLFVFSLLVFVQLLCCFPYPIGDLIGLKSPLSPNIFLAVVVFCQSCGLSLFTQSCKREEVATFAS